MKFVPFVFSLCLLLTSKNLIAQAPILVKDINSIVGGSYPSTFVDNGTYLFFSANSGIYRINRNGSGAATLIKNVNIQSQMINVGGVVFFQGYDTSDGAGPELWKSDGTAAGTVRLTDIYPGTAGSYPNDFVSIGSTLFFTAETSTYGRELWKFNGTTASLVSDIYPGTISSGVQDLNANGSTLYFIANNGTQGYELYSCTTTTGAVMIADLNPGVDIGLNDLISTGSKIIFKGYNGTNSGLYQCVGSSISLLKEMGVGEFTIVGSNVYFNGSDGSTGNELWKTNGTIAGTVLVKDIVPGSASTSFYEFEAAGTKLFFTADNGVNGQELWISDGTSAGTTMLEIFPGSSSYSPRELTVFNSSTIGFSANDGTLGRELWKSDGTLAGTTLVRDINPGPLPSTNNEYDLTLGSGVFIFGANDGTHGLELWKSSLTSGSTSLIEDLNTATTNSGSGPSSFTVLNKNLIFSADDGYFGRELWVTNSSGTNLLKDINPDFSPNNGSSSPGNLMKIGNTIFFTALHPSYGTELWKTDGSTSGTVLVADIYPGKQSSNLSDFFNWNGVLYFTAQTQTSGVELWRSDGTSSGTFLVKDIYAGSGSSNPSVFFVFNDKLFFRAQTSANGTELWQTDGTSSGTLLVKDINAGTSNSNPSDFLIFNNKLFFLATTSTNGTEIWQTDGTTSGTTLLKDISTGTGSSSPSDFIIYNNKLFFKAEDSTNGIELWQTDGTTAGTLVINVNPGSNDSDPNFLRVVNGLLLFTASNTGGPNTDKKLWAYNGTSPALLNTFSSEITSIINFNNAIYFDAGTSTNGSELWKSDGTTVGTVMVTDIYSGASGSNPANFITLGSTLLFTATNSTNGAELWASDGTSSGTQLLKDIYPGTLNSSPSNFKLSDGRYYFSASSAGGADLWQTDGTSAGTLLVSDINNAFSNLTFCDNVPFFTMNKSGLGNELFMASPLTPTGQPTSIVFSNRTTNSIDINFSSSSDASGYIAIRSTSIPSTDPSANVVYQSGNTLGNGTVAYVGSQTSFTDAGLTPGTVYYYKIYSYTGGFATSAYLTTSPLQGNATTLQNKPTNPPTLLSFPTITTSSLSGAFNIAAGNPSGYLILERMGSPSTDTPTDGVSYSAGSFIGSSKVVASGNSLTFDDTGLTPGSVYYYRIFSFNGAGGSTNYLTSSSLSNSQITLAVAPVITGPGGTNQNSFSISWSAVTGTSNYALDLSTTNFSTFVSGFQNKLLGNVTTFNLTGLNGGVNYQCRIRALNAGGSSDHSNKIEALTIPETPSTTSATDISSSSFTINWDPQSGTESFYLEVSIDNFGTFVPGFNPLVVPGPTSYSIVGLLPSTPYQYRLRAKNATGTSSNSTHRNTVTLATESLGQATNLVFSNVGVSGLSGSFTSSITTPAGYIVLYKAESSPVDIPIDGAEYTVGTLIGSSTVAYVGSTNKFSLSGLASNTNYFFDIFSFNGSTNTYNYLTVAPLEGDQFTLTSAPVNQPTLLKATAITTSSIQGDFKSAEADGYLVLRYQGNNISVAPSDGSTYPKGTIIGNSVVIYNGSDLTFTDAGLSAGTNYKYVVFSYNGSGTASTYLTAVSDENKIDIFTVPTAPVAKPVSNTAPLSFTANWDITTGATSYEIDVSSTDFSTLLPGFPKTGLTNNEFTVDNLSPDTDYKYRIRAINKGGTSANSNIISVHTDPVDNGSLPLSMTSPVLSKEGSITKASVTLSAGRGTRNVYFKYKGILSKGNFIEVKIQSESDLFAIAIDPFTLDEQGLEYFFVASDASVTSSLETNHNYFYRPISQNIPNLSAGGQLQNYRIISIPAKMERTDPSSVFNTALIKYDGYNKEGWRLLNYQPGEPQGKNIDFTSLTQIQTGNGYWFNSLDPIEIKVVGTAVEANQSAPFVLNLKKGWNQIGNPYTFNISWSDILAQNPDVKEAGTKFYEYDASNVSFKQNDIITAWSGGFVKATAAATLNIPVTVKQTTGGRKAINANEIENRQLNQPDWFLPIHVSQGDAYNEMGGIGMHHESSLSNDRYDEQSLPRFQNYLELNSYHPEFFLQRFTRDVVPTAASYTWDYTIESNFGKSQATLTWDAQSLGNNDSQLKLYDEEAGELIDMKKVSAYSFTLNDTRKIKIFYSADEKSLAPDISGMGKPYPNPFSQQVTVPFFTGNNSSHIQINIYDLTGRKVKELINQKQAAGFYQLQWDGQDEQGNRVANGVYLYRFTSSDSKPLSGRLVIK